MKHDIVVEIINEDFQEGQIAQVTTPQSLTAMMIPTSLAYACVSRMPPYSLNTPFESDYDNNPEVGLQALCDKVQVSTVDELRRVLWKVRTINESQKEVIHKHRDVVETKTILKNKQYSLKLSEGEGERCMEEIGCSSYRFYKREQETKRLSPQEQERQKGR